MTDVRKNLIVLALILIGILLTLVVFNLGLGPGNPRSRTSGSLRGGQKAQILNTENSRVYPSKLSKSEVNFFNVKSRINKVIFYEEIDSIVYETDFEGRGKKEITKIPNVAEIIFSPNGKELIAWLNERRIIRAAYFEIFENKKLYLPEGVRAAAFSPDGLKIAYHFYNTETGEGNIFISGPDGSNPTNIFKTRISNLKILWPDNNLIIFYTTAETGLIAFSITPDGKEFKRINEEDISFYLGQNIKEKTILDKLGIGASEVKLSPLADYLIFINKDDGKLYSLKIK